MKFIDFIGISINYTKIICRRSLGVAVVRPIDDKLFNPLF